MNTPDDRFWDELGVTWRAAQIDTTALRRRLRGQVQRESWRHRLGIIVSAMAGTIGVIFSVALIRTHETSWQGIGVVTLAGLVILAAVGAWIGRSPMVGETASLIGMLELAASQARRRRREAWALRYLAPALILIAIAAVLYAVRPRGRHLASDVLIALAWAVFMFFAARHQYLTSGDRERRLLHLKRELTQPESDEQ